MVEVDHSFKSFQQSMGNSLVEGEERDEGVETTIAGKETYQKNVSAYNYRRDTWKNFLLVFEQLQHDIQMCSHYFLEFWSFLDLVGERGKDE